MPENNSGIKISVQDEREEKIPAKKSASRPTAKIRSVARPKSTPKAKSVTQSTAKAKPAKKMLQKPTVKARVGKGGGIIKFVLAMMVPALIVGAGIYAWQNNIAKTSLTEARQEAMETEVTFEERLRNLKNKLTGVEDENQKLKEKSEEMNRRIALLDKAKIVFNDDELGFGFTYPAVFGEVVVTKTEIASGTKFIGTFSDNEKLVFGGISADLEFDKEKAVEVIAVTDNQGFMEDNGDYFFLAFNENEHEVKPAEILKTASDKKALLIDKNSFVIDPEADGLAVDIGGNVAVLLNLDSADYKGLVFMNSDFGMMPLESFKQMITSIKN
ncbi:MAG: hypothetical protein U9Q85_04420 [Patescibacteria group bacterium]|nr:hypothetical protein [Patescibacteria group bacterium]